MKQFFTISFILFISAMLFAQEIPNEGFESWTGNTPNLWFANNPPTGPQPVVPSLNSHNGMFSAQLRVVDLGGFPLPPQLSAGVNGNGFIVSQRYEALHGYYQFFPQTGDFFDVFIQMWVGGTQGTMIGSGMLSSSTGEPDWAEFVVPINYTDPATPDWCTIQIQVGAQTNVLGTALVDDLSFGSASAVKQIEGQPVSFKLMQNYPNPFNPITNIEYSISSESFVELKVYDILGKEVAILVNEQQPAGVYMADFDAVSLPSGLYFARLTANEFTHVIKMTLLK